MEKVDFKKELKQLYQASAKEVVRVDVPPMGFLMVDGQGDPNIAPAYQEAVEALFAVAYALKSMVKRGPLALDYGVLPLESLWWADDMRDFGTRDKSQRKWTAMVMQPPFITPAMMYAAVGALQANKALAALNQVRLNNFVEGKSAQILHIGPFSKQGPAIEKVHSFIAEHGKPRGKHHEIYLSDIRRAASEKWKTIIRQPMQ